MLSWPSNIRVFVCTKPTDIRRDRVKALWWDRDCLAIFAKRLEVNRYELPRFDTDHTGVEIDATTLSRIWNVATI